MNKNLGKKIACPKCQKKFYTMGQKYPSCPTCEKNDLIPEGGIAKVRLRIRPGGYNEETQGWTQGYASQGKTGAVYLNGEFTVLEGANAGKKIYSLIGLRSPKGPWWGNKGRSFIKNMLNSKHKLADEDNSPEALKLRRINSFRDIDGIEFLAHMKIATDANGRSKNEIEDVAPWENKDNMKPVEQPANDESDTLPNWMK
jgi:hypothetical protein